jgi:ATP-dependent Clp protease ATP-binding subunit ClpC
MNTDNILKRRCIRSFQKIIVEPTSVEETITILNNIKNKYEDHHNVIYSQEAIEACVKLTDRYMSERFLPDKAIDALDEAGSRVHITNIEVPKNFRFRTSTGRDSRTKTAVVKKKKYEEAAKLRDDEKRIEKKLAIAQEQWEEDAKNNRIEVTEDNVADVVSMMTGIP